ncbi:MAG: hypothetical protein IJ587_06070 [Synergistaceae bacterium]|nr:hypothetical protein [Synergistaceae bacterium]
MEEKQAMANLICDVLIVHVGLYEYLKRKEKTGDADAKSSLDLMKNLATRTVDEILDFIQTYK